MSETFVSAGQTAILLTTKIVSAYVAKNPVPVSGVPELIRSVHASLVGLAAPVPVEPRPSCQRLPRSRRASSPRAWSPSSTGGRTRR